MITCYFPGKKKVSLRHITVNGLVIDKNKLLLVKRNSKSFKEPNKWTIPGGYLKKDENMKQGLIREVLEETGYQAKVGPLFHINDNPYRKGDEKKQNVTFLFLMKSIKKIKDFDHEISAVKWFDLNNLPKEEETAFDHFQDFILLKKYLKKPFKLPIFTGSNLSVRS